jgi:hypothetical protein
VRTGLALHYNTLLRSIPASIAGCPTSRSFLRDVGNRRPPPEACCGLHNSVRVPHVRASVARISYYAALATTAYAAFSQRKPHGLAQRHHARQEIRDTWAEKRGRSPQQLFVPNSIVRSLGPERSVIKPSNHMSESFRGFKNPLPGLKSGASTQPTFPGPRPDILSFTARLNSCPATKTRPFLQIQDRVISLDSGLPINMFWR